tara:strand:- start:367 stop:891 length:525 start_codon:yes stop_codon:yes gene_type:complete
MVRISTPHPEITVYDDVFTKEKQTYIEKACNSFDFVIANMHIDEEKGIFSTITGELWNSTNNQFKKYLEDSKPFQDFAGRTLTACIVNLYTIADSQDIRTFKGHDVILYYANTNTWRPEFGGELLFYDNYGKSVICTVPTIPNRMVVFNGEILHRINTIHDVPMRTTVSALFPQ